MDLFFKLAPQQSLLASGIGELIASTASSTCQKDDMNFRLYSTSTLVLLMVTVTQVAKGDYHRALNVTLMSCYLNILMTPEISGLARKLNPFLILLLTKLNW